MTDKSYVLGKKISSLEQKYPYRNVILEDESNFHIFLDSHGHKFITKFLIKLRQDETTTFLINQTVNYELDKERILEKFLIFLF